MHPFSISTFYHFFKINNLEQVKLDLKALAKKNDILGLIVTGPEGINSTIASSTSEAMVAFKKELQKYFGISIANFKDSASTKPPFRRFSVKVRDEIVTTGIPGKVPNEDKNSHLSPDQWDHILKNEKDFVMIDTRNWYEYKIGTFKGALNPNIEKFTEFPEYFESQKIPKDKKIMIFCTGGIRCEKGILELQDKGYNNVYQLDGGILTYLKEKPNEEFIGECFVFDNRVAVDQNLSPSEKFKLCPHCGQPAETKINCQQCDEEALICDDCLKLDLKKSTCSKNCAYQATIHPGRKKEKSNRKSKQQLQHCEIQNHKTQ